MMKLVVDRRSDRVVGCHMVGADAPEIIQGLAMRSMRGDPNGGSTRPSGIHPSTAEEFVTLPTRCPSRRPRRRRAEP